MWNGLLPKLYYPELHSFTWNKCISIQKVSHPEIFEFQDVIKIKNKTIIFSRIGLSVSKSISLKEASSIGNESVKQAKGSWSYRNHWQIVVLNPVSTNHSLKLFNLRMTTLSRRIMMCKELWWSRKIAQMDVLLFHVNRGIFHNSVATVAS